MQEHIPTPTTHPLYISDTIPIPIEKQEFDLTGLSVPANNPYKKMSRVHLIQSLKKLEAKNKELNNRLVFLEPQKQKEPPCGSEEKRGRLFKEYQVKKYCLRIAYIGVSYNGFVLQSSTDNTVEYFLFKSLYACNLIQNKEPGDDYTRAGRTDRGVSSFGNVIALNLRTTIPKTQSTDPNPNPNQSQKSIKPLDYCKLLNQNLPSDIRILSCQQVPQDFNARYSCIQRQYKYFFLRSFYDLQRMSEAMKHFVGTHNFINFCRIDVIATTNHERTIRNASIKRFQEWQTETEVNDFRNEIYYFHFIGNAFLWHQIRFMVTILFMVGSHKEQPIIVKQMLDTKLFPRKPNYPISPQYPLILQNCKYQNHEFNITKDQVLNFYNSFIEVMMRKTIELSLFYNCIGNIQTSILFDLKIDKKELTKLCIQQESKIFKTKAKKKLSLQKTSCTNLKEAIDRLSGKRLDLFQKRMEKQIAYQERVKSQNQQNEEKQIPQQGRQDQGEE